MPGNKQDELDDLLKAGLASYADAEPRLGMEERVLRRAREPRVAPRFRVWQWAAACACVAILAVLAALFATRPGKTDAAHPGVASLQPNVAQRTSAEPAGRPEGVAAPELSETSELPEPLRRHIAPVRSHRTGPAAPAVTESSPARSKFFPVLQPLTAEERRIIAAIQQHPAEVTQALTEAQAESAEPIHIAAIQIEPLQ
ncbi:MAG TPA: hypothetical protein VM554_09310 [Acidisarcina sp.]|nr:hypothetical protein [Acidisarcina sp.]